MFNCWGFSTILIRIFRLNNIKNKPAVSEEVPDTKKLYWEQPAINVSIFTNDAERPTLLPNDLTAKTKATAMTISNARTALYSSLNNCKNGMIEKLKPGGNNWCLSNTGVLISAVKYFVTPRPLPARKFFARVI